MNGVDAGRWGHWEKRVHPPRNLQHGAKVSGATGQMVWALWSQSQGARCLDRGSRCGPFRILSPKCLCLLCSSAQQRGEEISCPPIEDTGSGGERAFPKPTARKAWPSTQHPLELCPVQASCLPRASSLLSPVPALLPGVKHQRQSLALLLLLLPPP